MPEETQQKKTLEPGKAGPLLKARRQALRLSLAQVEVDTKIRGKFLTALESGHYDSLPNDIYSRGFVAHYANHLGLDGEEVARAYAAERGGIAAGETRRPRLERPRLVFTGQIAWLMGAGAAAAAIVWYLLWQLSSLAAAPNLSVTNPAVDESVDGAVITVSGHTTPGTDVSVDGSPILSDTNGNFSEKVALENGLNTIKITSISKLGKRTTVVRNVLAKLPTVNSAAAGVPAATFAGVAVAVKVSETTALVVMVDGQTVFKGTFVAGTSQLFVGKSDVNITTGNAGATSVTVTNNVVANKVIQKLGDEGEIRRGQDFAVGTVIP